MRRLISILVLLLVISLPFAVAESYSYDANGNRISGDGFYRVYDSSNHLVNVYTGSEPLISNLVENYTWALNEERVVAKYTYFNETLNESVYYPYENWVRVVNSSGSFDFYYVIQNSEVVAMQDYAGHKFYYHNDHKGSVQLVTNENGSAIERTFYEPFGAITFGGNERFTYEGEEFDSVTGDYDFDARRMDPLNNQFIQPDSVIQNVYDPQSLNHYSFERNNPYKYEDENGHYVETALDVAFIVYDVYDIKENGFGIVNTLSLGADIAGAALPFATGLGMGVRVVAKADDVADTAKVLDKADNTVKDLSQSQFRRNLEKVEPKPFENAEAHHVIPKNPEIRPKLNEKGISDEFINSIDNAAWVPKGHGGSWKNYEKDLMNYIKDNPNAKSNEIINAAREQTRVRYGGNAGRR